MQELVHPESGLSKATWTHHDLEAMSWDLCQIHALAMTDYEVPEDLTPEEFLEQDDVGDDAPSFTKLHFDLDYIVRRVRGRSGMDYWASPATLVFHNVDSVSGELHGVWHAIQMRSLTRTVRAVGYETLVGWKLAGDHFELGFGASGFTLYLRQPPRYGNRVIQLRRRGGISFEPRSFA